MKLWKKLNELSHTFGFDTPNARLCSEAALLLQRQEKALRQLRDQANTRPVFVGNGVKAVREAGKFIAAIDEANKVLGDKGQDYAD